VLPRPRRVNRPADFRRVLRRGRKCGRRRLVVHAHRDVPADGAPGAATGPLPARAGLVVGRGVGPAVVRHRVSRRLRHLLAPRLDLLAPGTDLVVRAQAPAGDATSSELAEDLDAALRRLGLIEGPR
jgi:ribonuclease P protein component